jgi:hypothetical protein
VERQADLIARLQADLEVKLKQLEKSEHEVSKKSEQLDRVRA